MTPNKPTCCLAVPCVGPNVAATSTTLLPYITPKPPGGQARNFTINVYQQLAVWPAPVPELAAGSNTIKWVQANMDNLIKPLLVTTYKCAGRWHAHADLMLNLSGLDNNNLATPMHCAHAWALVSVFLHNSRLLKCMCAECFAVRCHMLIPRCHCQLLLLTALAKCTWFCIAVRCCNCRQLLAG